MNDFKRKLQVDYQEYKKKVEKVENIEIKGMPKYYKMFDESGEYVGWINTKFEKMQNRYIKVISTFLITNDGKVIIELRSKDCNLEPNQRDLCSGHIDREEKSDETVYRESKEELEVQKNRFICCKKLKMKYH